MISIRPGEVHVWSADLPSADFIFRDAYLLLSSEERLVADRFHREEDRRRYVFSHLNCRVVLSRYLAIAPEKILYSRDRNNKPCLKMTAEIQFNLSHAHHSVFVAVSTSAVGVDVEYMDRGVDYLAVAKRYFTDSEYRAILHAPDQEEYFFRCWTLKEAYLKARGVGLVHGLTSFDVDPAQKSLKNQAGINQPITVNAVDDSEWWCQSFDIDNSYCAAVAAKQPVSLIMRDFIS